MKKLLKEKQVYIDTNIYVYVALKHPDFYKKCYNVLEMLVSNEFIGYGSTLVAFELFGSLSKISAEAAYEAVSSYLNLPLITLKINKDTFTYAREIAMLSNTSYDSLHAALIAQNNIEIIVTEDLDNWSKILNIWPKIEKSLKLKV